MTRTAVRVWTTAGLVACASALGASGLHPALVRSEPASGVRLATAPREIALWFTERPEVPFSSIRLSGAGGDVTLGALRADSGHALRVDVRGTMLAGEYRVTWQTAGPDGHLIRGEYAFALDTGGGRQAAGTSRAGPAESVAPVAPAPGARRSTVVLAARWIEYVALLAVIGALVFGHGVLPALATRGVPTSAAALRARAFGAGASVVYLMAAAVRLVATAATAATAPAARDGLVGAAVHVAGASSWGHAWTLGAAGGILALSGNLLWRRGIRAGVPASLAGALAMTLSAAMTGHAVAASSVVLGVGVDALHVATVGAWVGGLLSVLLIGVPAMVRRQDGNPDAGVSALVNSFHPIALVSASLAVLTGAGNAVLRLGALDALGTEYGRVLLIKLGLVVLVAGIGAYNSSRVRRRLGDASGTATLRRTATTEVVLAATVVAVTVVLVGTTLPDTPHTP